MNILPDNLAELSNNDLTVETSRSKDTQINRRKSLETDSNTCKKT